MGTRNHSPRLSPNALTVLRQRYLAKNERGVVIESPAAMFHRVADDVASIEPPAHRRRLSGQFYDAMALTQNFKSMLDSLRIIRDNSNAVRNYLESTKDAGQAIVAPNVNTLNNTSNNQSLNIGDHFKQIRNQSGNFVSQLVLLREFLVTGALADLSDRIQKFHELSNQIRPVLDKIKEDDKKATDLVGNMSRLLEQANSYVGNIEGVKNKSTEINSNSEAALNEINAKLAKIRETTTEAEKLRTQVDQYQSQYKAFDEELTARLNRFKEFDKANRWAAGASPGRP